MWRYRPFHNIWQQYPRLRMRRHRHDVGANAKTRAKAASRKHTACARPRPTGCTTAGSRMADGVDSHHVRETQGQASTGMGHMFYGSVGQVVASSTVMVNGRQVSPTGGSVRPGRAVVGIDAPEMSRLCIQGSSEVRLLGLRQRRSDLNIAAHDRWQRK